MGLTTAYVLRPDQDGVWQASDRPYLRDVDAEPAGPMLAARVIDSDVCLVLGRSPDHSEWRWVFGEAAATAYAREAGVPGPWLPTLDAEVLEETLDARAQEAAAEIQRWALAAGVTVPETNALLDVLAENDVFAEAGWWRLLDALDLDGSTDEPEYAGAEADELAAITRMLARDREPRPTPPTRAIALDHSSSGWHRLNASHLLGRFGEPPCLVEHLTTTYLGTDPPVAIGGFMFDDKGYAEMTGATGAWVEVPADAATDVAAAAAWASQHVGTAGKPAGPDRPPVWAELAPQFLPDRSEYYWYGLAPPVTTSLRLRLAEDVDPVQAATAAAYLTEQVTDRVVTAAAAHGRHVSYGEESNDHAYGFEVVGVQRSTRGRFSATKGDAPSWRRTVSRFGAGELVLAGLTITRTDGFGASHMAVARVEFELDVRGAKDRDGSPFVSLVVDAEFDQVLPRAHLLTVALNVVDVLPVTSGWFDVGRFSGRTNVGRWGTLRPAGAEIDRSAFADVVPVRSTAADLLFTTATNEPAELTLAARDAVSQALGDPPLDLQDAQLYGV